MGTVVLVAGGAFAAFALASALGKGPLASSIVLVGGIVAVLWPLVSVARDVTKGGAHAPSLSSIRVFVALPRLFCMAGAGLLAFALASTISAGTLVATVAAVGSAIGSDFALRGIVKRWRERRLAHKTPQTMSNRSDKKPPCSPGGVTGRA